MSTTTIHSEDVHTQYPATVVSSKRLIAQGDNGKNEIREIVIEVLRPEFACRVGQSIGVLAPMPSSSKQPHHLRWYSIADIPSRSDTGNPCFTICVRRCFCKNPDTGLVYKGITSNYLCDLEPGDRLSVTGPYGLAFKPPRELDATLILIATGTGIAPFRAFMKHLHQKVDNWTGTVRLFYGAKNGLDILYVNDENADVMQYFDQETFDAFQALSPKPHWADPISWDLAFSERADELLKLLEDPKTYVYVAGLERIRDQLDALMSSLLGSQDNWQAQKQQWMEQGRWEELIY